MQYLHQLLGTAVLVVAVLYIVVAGLGARLDRWHPTVRQAGAAITGLLAVEAAAGAYLYVTGSRPAEALHLLYGLAIIVILPLGSSFASEAPAHSRSAVAAVAGAVVLLLAWRLLSTG